MKLFRTSNIDIVNYCRAEFNFELPGTVIEQRSSQFTDKYRSCDNLHCHLHLLDNHGLSKLLLMYAQNSIF